MTTRPESHRRAGLEVAAVILTGGVHLVFEEVLHMKAPFIVLAVLGWGLYLGMTIRRNPGVLEVWGLRIDRLPRDARWPGLVVLGGIAALAVAGAVRGNLTFTWHMLPLLVLYPIWGTLQQFMLQAMVSRNLETWLTSRWWITAVAAVLFGAVHWPDRFLMGGTFVLALLFTPLYLRDRSLLPLGIAHGWLGVLAYYWLLGRDPGLELWMELFGS
jgi:hypothetical protein